MERIFLEWKIRDLKEILIAFTQYRNKLKRITSVLTDRTQ